MGILKIILITLLPFLELRASIPYGIVELNLNPYYVFFVAVLANIVLGVVIYFLIKYLTDELLKIKNVERLYNIVIKKNRKKVEDYIKKYGKLGLIIFIAIPLPGSGVYSASIGSYFLGIKFKDYLIAEIIGVILAGIFVTIITLTGKGFFSLLLLP